MTRSISEPSHGPYFIEGRLTSACRERLRQRELAILSVNATASQPGEMWSRRHVSSLPRSTSYLVSLIDSFEQGSKQPRSIASSFPSSWPEFVKITRYVVTSWWDNDSRNFTYSSAMELDIGSSDSRQTLVLRFFAFSSFLAIRFRRIVRRWSFLVFYSCLVHLWSQFTNIAVYRRVVNSIVKRIIIWFILLILYALFLISKFSN